MSLLLQQLESKSAVDDAIRETQDRVLVLRFGRSTEISCMQQDEILSKCEYELSKMARVCLVEVDKVPVYCHYFDITLIPATVFFVNGQHMKVNYSTPDHTKFIGAFQTKQDFVDLVEVLCDLLVKQVIYRGAKRGKSIVTCPIEKSHIPQYQLIYKDI
ncbi:hypothetical protein PsorP6_002740 [Peronosclerospora sorghi]|uniref:Uncharacterized protein n=1 Tax=Peronosclerospora sorghi TaxID=230839 RepID=A0ACC0WV10_9STRA|nr:hypothetical protein PsorP6_002740 [Peronosclerospora sorghi]